MSLAPGAPHRPAVAGAIPAPPVTALLPRRLIAHLVDGVLLGVLTAPLLVIAFIALERRTGMAAAFLLRRSVATLLTAGTDRAIDTVRTGAALYWDGVVLVVGVALTVQWIAIQLYDWVLHAVPGRSVGKAVTGLRVVPVEWLRGDYRRRRPGCGRAALRTSVRVGLPRAATVVLVFVLMDGQPALFAAGGLLAVLSYLDLLWLAVVRDGRRLPARPGQPDRRGAGAMGAAGPVGPPGERAGLGPAAGAPRTGGAGRTGATGWTGNAARPGDAAGPPGALPRRCETGR